MIAPWNLFRKQTLLDSIGNCWISFEEHCGNSRRKMRNNFVCSLLAENEKCDGRTHSYFSGPSADVLVIRQQDLPRISNEQGIQIPFNEHTCKNSFSIRINRYSDSGVKTPRIEFNVS